MKFKYIVHLLLLYNHQIRTCFIDTLLKHFDFLDQNFLMIIKTTYRLEICRSCNISDPLLFCKKLGRQLPPSSYAPVCISIPDGIGKMLSPIFKIFKGKGFPRVYVIHRHWYLDLSRNQEL